MYILYIRIFWTLFGFYECFFFFFFTFLLRMYTYIPLGEELLVQKYVYDQLNSKLSKKFPK